MNPYFAYKYEKISIDKVSDDFLIAKLKQETHYLEKCIKNPYSVGRGKDRKKILFYILKK